MAGRAARRAPAPPVPVSTMDGLWPMRGKLIIFVLLFAIAGLVVGWRFGNESPFFDSRSVPVSLRSFRELADVPERSGLTLPSEVRVALTNAAVSQIEIA